MVVLFIYKLVASNRGFYENKNCIVQKVWKRYNQEHYCLMSSAVVDADVLIVVSRRPKEVWRYVLQLANTEYELEIHTRARPSWAWNSSVVFAS